MFASCLTEAFSEDLLINYLFERSSANHRQNEVHEFFETLLEARVSLDMPCLGAIVDGSPAGAAMGYDVTRPVWKVSSRQRWENLLNRLPFLGQNLDTYASVAEPFEPRSPHYYLGVIGVADRFRGSGIGKSLLKEFSRLSDADKASAGVFLETCSEQSLQFYLRNGFEVTGETKLGGRDLWCCFLRSA